MQVSEIKNEGLELHCKVIIPVSQINSSVSVRLDDLAKTVKLPGFRPGKVPLKVVEQKYAEAVRAEIFEKEIEKSVGKLIKDKSLKLASQAQIKDVVFEPNKDLEFVVLFEKMPDVKDVDFSKIKIEKPLVKASEKEMAETLEKLVLVTTYKKAAKTSKAAIDDKVVIDFEGFMDGKAFPGGKAEGHNLVLGSKSFIPGFEDQLVGGKAGDDILVKVKFPDEYHAKDLAGKESEFKVKIHEVHKAEKKSDLTDEMAAQRGFKDLADAKEKVQTNFEKVYQNESFTYQKMKLFDQLEKLLDFNVPSSILENEKKALLAQITSHKHEDEDLKNKSDAEIEEYATRIASRRVRIGLMLADYAEKNSINLTNDDYRKAILDQVNQFPGMEQRIIEYYTKNKAALQNLAGPILEDKSVAHILENKVKLSEKEYSADKFQKMMEELDTI